MKLSHSLVVLSLSLLAALASAEKEVVVLANNPAGDSVAATGADTFFPIASAPGFGYNNIRVGTAGIDGTYARSGNGSAHFVNNNGKGDIEFYNLAGVGLAPLGRLADVTTFGYDYYRSSASTAGATFSPVIRLFVDLDGNLATTNDRGLVIYEPYYDGVTANGSYTAPTNTWTTSTTTQTTGRYYTRFAGTNQFQIENGKTLAYLTDPNTTGLLAPTNNGNAVVYGFNAGVGSGWNGTFDGAVDNVRLGFGTSEVTRYNFERSAVPEPASMAALGLGALGLLKRRKKAAK